MGEQLMVTADSSITTINNGKSSPAANLIIVSVDIHQHSNGHAHAVGQHRGFFSQSTIAPLEDRYQQPQHISLSHFMLERGKVSQSIPQSIS